MYMLFKNYACCIKYLLCEKIVTNPSYIIVCCLWVMSRLVFPIYVSVWVLCSALVSEPMLRLCWLVDGLWRVKGASVAGGPASRDRSGHSGRRGG